VLFAGGRRAGVDFWARRCYNSSVRCRALCGIIPSSGRFCKLRP